MPDTPIYKMLDRLIEQNIEKFYSGRLNRDESINIVSRYIELSKKVDFRLTGKGYNALGIFYFTSSDYQTALNMFEQAKSAFTQANHIEGIASAFSNMGEVYRKLGAYDQSIEAFQQAIKLAESVSLQTPLAFAMCNLGTVHLEKGDYQGAIDLLENGLGLNDAGTRWETEVVQQLFGEALSNLARAYAHLGDFPKAQDYLKRTEFYISQKESLQDRADYYNALITVKLLQNPHSEDIDNLFRTREELLTALESNADLAHLKIQQGNYFRTVGNSELANKAFHEALDRVNATGDPILIDAITTRINQSSMT